MCEALSTQISDLANVKKRTSTGWKIFSFVCLGIAAVATIALFASGVGAPAGVGTMSAIMVAYGGGMTGSITASIAANRYQDSAN